MCQSASFSAVLFGSASDLCSEWERMIIQPTRNIRQGAKRWWELTDSLFESHSCFLLRLLLPSFFCWWWGLPCPFSVVIIIILIWLPCVHRSGARITGKCMQDAAVSSCSSSSSSSLLASSPFSFHLSFSIALALFASPAFCPFCRFLLLSSASSLFVSTVERKKKRKRNKETKKGKRQKRNRKRQRESKEVSRSTWRKRMLVNNFFWLIELRTGQEPQLEGNFLNYLENEDTSTQILIILTSDLEEKKSRLCEPRKTEGITKNLIKLCSQGFKTRKRREIQSCEACVSSRMLSWRRRRLNKTNLQRDKHANRVKTWKQIQNEVKIKNIEEKSTQTFMRTSGLMMEDDYCPSQT